MKATEYNQFSSQYVRKLKPNERAVYRVINIKEDPDNYGKFIIPTALQIPSTDIIYDKVKDDFVTIACIERVGDKGEANFANIVFTSQTMGYIFLNGNNSLHQKMYQFMELCNYNASNKERNNESEILFQRIDAKKDAINERELRRKIYDAVSKALMLDDKQAKDVANSLGFSGGSLDEIRNYLEDYATDNPEEFLTLVERASLSSESMLREAVKAGFIRNNINASRFEWADTKTEIYKYKKVPNKNYFKELAEYLEANNPDVLEAISTRLG